MIDLLRKVAPVKTVFHWTSSVTGKMTAVMALTRKTANMQFVKVLITFYAHQTTNVSPQLVFAMGFRNAATVRTRRTAQTELTSTHVNLMSLIVAMVCNS